MAFTVNMDDGKETKSIGERQRNKLAKKYENPGDGSIPGRYHDESLREYNERRNKGLREAMNS